MEGSPEEQVRFGQLERPWKGLARRREASLSTGGCGLVRNQVRPEDGLPMGAGTTLGWGRGMGLATQRWSMSGALKALSSMCWRRIGKAPSRWLALQGDWQRLWACSFYISRYWLPGIVRLWEWSRCALWSWLWQSLGTTQSSPISREIKASDVQWEGPEFCRVCLYWVHGYMFTGPCLLGVSKEKGRLRSVFVCAGNLRSPCMTWFCSAHPKTLMMPFSHIFTWPTWSGYCLMFLLEAFMWVSITSSVSE